MVILLALTAATVWTGAFGGEAAEDLHEIIGWTLLAMIALHMIAIIVMSLIQRENLARAMITGFKPAARHPGGIDARPPTILAVGIAILVIAATAYAILRYDPEAFTLRSAEAFEHRGDSGIKQGRGQGEEED